MQSAGELYLRMEFILPVHFHVEAERIMLKVGKLVFPVNPKYVILFFWIRRLLLSSDWLLLLLAICIGRERFVSPNFAV